MILGGPFPPLITGITIIKNVKLEEETAMEEEKRLLLLQVTDSVFPIGAYSHSFGLETYIQKGRIRNREGAWKFIRQTIRYPLTFTELLGMRLAWEAGKEGNYQRIEALEERLAAFKVPEETRTASEKLASRFIKTAGLMLKTLEEEKGDGQEEKEDSSAKPSLRFAKYGERPNPHQVNAAYGVFAAVTGIELEELLTFYLYSQVSAMVVNCVKTIPLSQSDGQALLTKSIKLQQEAVKKVLAGKEEYLGLSMPGFDLACMEHEALYSRLYMS